MSIATDLASLKIIANVLKQQDTKALLTKTVHSLVETVPSIDWVGVYIFEGERKQLVAASSFEHDFKKTHGSELTCPIHNSNDIEIGVMTVRTKQTDALDATDCATLQTIASAIGQETPIAS